jgi:hypothetical protein
VLVIDRSASLHPSRADAWDEVQDASTYFLDQFDNDADRLAVVSFGSGGNIDFALNTGFKNGSAAANSILNQTVPNGAATNSPQGLWLGYSELLRVGDGDALNVIVFFTDGQPSGYSNSFPVKTTGTGPKCDSSPKAAAIATVQPAAYFSDILLFTNPIAGPPPVNGGSTVNDYPTLSSCSNLTSNAGNVELLFATNQIPSTWQVSAAAGNKTFSLVSGPYSGVNPADSRMYNNNTGSDANFRGQPVHDAAKNLTVNIAQAARQDDGLGNVRIYSIGMGGWGYPADADFLQRVANDTQAPSGGFFSDEPTGLYVYAPTPAQLHQAFQSVAREIFRLIR